MQERGRRLGVFDLVGVAALALLLASVAYNVRERQIRQRHYNEPSPFTYENIPWKVQGGSFRRTDVVPVQATRCNHTDTALTYSFTRTMRSLDDTTIVYPLPQGSTTADPGCFTSVSRASPVPPDAPPGRYRLDGVATIQGRYRSFALPWRTEVFQVAP